jgi:DNA (cytosine-5)-methyltransferase 1
MRPMKRPRLTFGSLFAGVGGFDLGFERAGLCCRWQVELDPACSAVLARHWPGVTRFTDVREVGKHNLPPVAVIVGGFPCQDLSVAGKRQGLLGDRSSLFYEMTRIAHELRPRLLVWENVPGLLTSDGGRDFARVLLELGRVGFHGGWSGLDARYFGLAQRRRRLFGVFARGDTPAGRCAEILALRERRPWHLAARGQAGAAVASSLRSRSHGPGVNPPGCGGEDDSNLVCAVTPIDMRQASRGGTMTNNRGTDVAGGGAPGTGVGEEGDPCPTLADTHTPVVARTVTGQEGKRLDGDPSNFVAFAFQERGREGGLSLEVATFQCHDGGPGARGIQAIPVDVAPPVDTRTKDGPIRNQGGLSIVGGLSVRRLTPVECERLQGFPDGWTEGHPDTTRYRMLGNACAVPVCAWLGRQIVRLCG